MMRTATKLLMSHGLTATEAWGAQCLAKASERWPDEYKKASLRAVRRDDCIGYMVQWAQEKLQGSKD